jgi:hypothetical protein
MVFVSWKYVYIDVCIKAQINGFKNENTAGKDKKKSNKKEALQPQFYFVCLFRVHSQ